MEKHYGNIPKPRFYQTAADTVLLTFDWGKISYTMQIIFFYWKYS